VCTLTFDYFSTIWSLECHIQCLTSTMVCGSPLDLCDRVIANGEIPAHSFTMQAHSPHGNGPALPSGGLHRGASMWPPSSGMPPGLPGSNGIPLGPLMGSSSAAINAAAARWLPSLFQ
jgi:hypothetical protein